MPDPTREELLVAAALALVRQSHLEATAASLTNGIDGHPWDPDRLDELLSRARALLGDGWRPIETAPKDGTVILGYDARLATPKLSCTMAVIFFDADGIVSGLPRMWWGTTPGSFVMTAPTHWRPLPAPPSEKPDA